jgi:hypothetical protein
MGYIYKITNTINNKCYIGITTIGRKSIQSNMIGRSKSAGGYVWKYADKDLKDLST